LKNDLRWRRANCSKNKSQQNDFADESCFREKMVPGADEGRGQLMLCRAHDLMERPKCGRTVKRGMEADCEDPSSKSQDPGKIQAPKTKSQTPNPKSQTNPKPQVPG